MPEPSQNRFQFATRMAQLREGLSCADVIATLGPPDDIRTRSDEDAGLLYGTTEMWCYGTDGHLGFPTLGHLYLDQRKRIHHHHVPTMPAPELSGMFDEAELRELLRLLDLAPPPARYAFQPRLLAQIVNRLQPIGKARALGAVTEYLRVAPHYVFHPARSGIFLVLRLLFDLPETHASHPDVLLGMSSPLPPADDTLVPRFPITVQGDIPFVLVNGYTLRGAAQPAEEHVEFYTSHGSVRRSPLVPTSRPFAILDEITRTPLSAWLEEDVLAHGHLVEQMTRAVDSVYRPVRPNAFLDLDLPALREWVNRYDRDTRSRGLHWDSRLNDYVCAAINRAWLTSDVVALATGIDREGAFDRLPILADALQDAGCEKEDVLSHCRGGGPCVRESWVVDLLLGTERP